MSKKKSKKASVNSLFSMTKEEAAARIAFRQSGAAGFHQSRRPRSVNNRAAIKDSRFN